MKNKIKEYECMNCNCKEYREIEICHRIRLSHFETIKTFAECLNCRCRTLLDEKIEQIIGMKPKTSKKHYVLTVEKKESGFFNNSNFITPKLWR